MNNSTVTILIIHANEQLRQHLCNQLHKQGYACLVAANQHDVADHIVHTSTSFAAILLDAQLPDMPAADTLAYLRRQPMVADIPILVLTAVPDPAERMALMQMGAQDYLPSATSPDELLARIATQIELHGLRQQNEEAQRLLQRQQQYLQAITQIGMQAAQCASVQQMVSSTTQAVVAAFPGSEGCCIYLCLPSNGELQLAHVYPAAAPDDFSLPAAVRQVQQTRQRAIMVSGTAVPIAHDHILLGIIGVQTTSLQLAQEIEPTLSSLAVQLSTVITNLQLFEDIRARNHKLENLVQENKNLLTREQQQRKQSQSLYYMAQIIGSSLDEEEVLEATVDTIRALFAVETAGIRLLEGTTQYFTFDPNLQEGAIIKHINQPTELGIIDYVVSSKKPLILNHVSSHPRFRATVDAPSTASPQNMLCTPLIIRDNVIGAIQLINKRQGMFDQSDLNLLNVIASSIAVAIDNAQLFQQQVKLTEQLKQSQKQLVQSEKMSATGRLAASLAHEINNPLQAIQSCLQLIIDFNLSKTKQIQYLDMAREEVVRLSEMVTRILEFSRPAANEQKLIVVNDLIDQVLQLSHKHISQHDWHIQTELSATLSPVLAIPDQISQVFLSVILNAFDAIRKNGVIRITTKEEGGWVKTIVSDNGCGMMPEAMEHVFEPFYTTKSDHSGLGLTICYHIINQHRGKIEVQSRPGAGTVFSICLPVAESEH